MINGMGRAIMPIVYLRDASCNLVFSHTLLTAAQKIISCVCFNIILSEVANVLFRSHTIRRRCLILISSGLCKILFFPSDF